ncbi:hypothetical protein PROFUN_16747 [Planoprotostelium fungivorum]|uniref:Uncharacterized protein n=1 Tax=Planoprotostelium fungivorum TaxID=1890364 RepID=A0A2P6MNN1_9EUKA|nr:hypothetical protein PROFUN_16747 [Planoprotostelium fungivorum]
MPCATNRTEEAERVIFRVQERYAEITRKNVRSFYNKCNVVRAERKEIVAEAILAIQRQTIDLDDLLGSSDEEESTDDSDDSADSESDEADEEDDVIDGELDDDIWEDSFNPATDGSHDEYITMH